MLSAQAQLIAITRKLSSAVGRLSFGDPTRYVYNPLVYARAPHEEYLRRYGSGSGRTLLVGMNPGPFGMAQTGIPFGDVRMVRDFLGISAKIARPASEHPARPVLGFDCRRSEVSGTRLWGWARDRFSEPAAFFERFFVINFCPLAFLEEGGKNRTPDKLPPKEKQPLLAACDQALSAMVDVLEPSLVVGIGGFAEASAKRALANRELRVGGMLHPSPANPRANAGWASIIEEQLQTLGVRF
jgi:single-strand selective monofunctional uracil DNA glycosylase